MEKKANPEKRLELARYIREENMGNRFRLRQREHILYGKELQPPLLEKDAFSETGGVYSGYAGMGETQSAAGSFKYRMTLAVLLFVGFLLCDTKQGKILSFDTNQIYEMIRTDSLRFNEADGNAVMEEVAELLE